MRRKRRDPLRLVGYARASGDGALVGTIHDVAVAPPLRGRGLGRALMRRLMQQVCCTIGGLMKAQTEKRLSVSRVSKTAPEVELDALDVRSRRAYTCAQDLL